MMKRKKQIIKCKQEQIYYLKTTYLLQAMALGMIIQ